MNPDHSQMLPYELTPAAEADLREIARYTLRQWGERQAQRYASLLEACFQGIAQNSVLSRTFSERYPQVRVTRCEHHYIFYLFPEGMRPRIIAVLHENMDLVTRVRRRLSTSCPSVPYTTPERWRILGEQIIDRHGPTR